MTPEQVEREYNNRALVPDFQQYFDRWKAESEMVRATLPCELDAAYGPHARHRVDLFKLPKPRGTMVFIHGGYWRSLDKSLFAGVAAAWMAEKMNVALVNYRLCPEVRIGDIVDDIVAATNWLYANGPARGFAMDRVVFSGHSAGGHLVAALFATPRGRLAFDPATVAGGVPISGIFDFEPMPRFSGNAEFQLDAAAVARLNLLERERAIAAPLVVAAGGLESNEFRRQSRELARAWAPQVKEHLVLPGRHHFSVVDAFTEPGDPLHSATRALIA